MCPSDPLGNHGQGPIAVSLVFEPVLAHEDGMGLTAPLPHQGRAGLQRSAGVERTSAFLELSRQNVQAALQGGGRAAMGTLLQLIGETPDDQIATEAQRRADVMQSPPRTPQLLCRLTDQLSDFAINRCQCQTSQPVLPAAVCTERLARVLASRSVVDWRFHRLGGSAMRYTPPRSALAEASGSPSFLFRVPEKTPRTV